MTRGIFLLGGFSSKAQQRAEMVEDTRRGLEDISALRACLGDVLFDLFNFILDRLRVGGEGDSRCVGGEDDAE